ncbi:MAG: hypothetical protein AB8G86_30090 [Saprospiraceae bacterium]
MKNNYTPYILVVLSLLFIAAAIYFHNGYFDLVNRYIYNDAAIPSAFKADKFYFMNKKLALKNRTIYGLCFFSTLLFLFNRNITHKQLRILLFLQCLVVGIALLFWLILPKGGLIY